MHLSVRIRLSAYIELCRLSRRAHPPPLHSLMPSQSATRTVRVRMDQLRLASLTPQLPAEPIADGHFTMVTLAVPDLEFSGGRMGQSPPCFVVGVSPPL